MSQITEQKREEHVLGNKNIVQLNVGGTVFLTSRGTLLSEPTTYFSAMLSKNFRADIDSNGKACYFIDRDPTHFRHILNYLRGCGNTGKKVYTEVPETLTEILEEAQFYQIQGLSALLARRIEKINERNMTAPSDEKEYKLFTDVSQEDVKPLFQEWVLIGGYDFESWVECDKETRRGTRKEGARSYNIIFSKPVSREDLRLVNRMMKTT